MENNTAAEKKPNYTVLRVIVIGAILVLLVFVSIGIVRIVPKALNSLANASLSIGSLLDTQSTSTPSTNQNASSTGGFSIRELTDRNLDTPGNYVPASSTLPTQSGNSGTISGNTSGVGSSNNAGNNYGSNYGTVNNSGSNTSHTNTGSSASTAYTVGASDIAVTITSRGVINRQTGAFIETSNFTTSDLVVVKFKIENRGAYATGIWSARVDMPSNNANDRLRSLNGNKSLPAGAAVTGEARFDNPTAGTPSVVITVDTANATNDVNRGNNIATLPISVSGSNIGGTGSGTYNPGTQADLVVRTLSTGTVNQYGQYVPNTSPRYGEKAAVQFEVSNIGGQTSNAWNWRTDVSGAITNTYNAPTESGLAPGSAVRLIVGFDVNTYGYNGSYYGNNNCQAGPFDIYTGAYIGYQNCGNTYNPGYGYGTSAMYFTISVDTTNAVYESNESNNAVSATVNIVQ